MKSSKQTKPFVVIVIGAVMLVLTPVFLKGILAYLDSQCIKNEYGECPFSINFPNSINSIYLTIAWAILGVIIICVGLYLRYRRKK